MSCSHETTSKQPPVNQGWVSDHLRIDERSLALHQAIQQKLIENPTRLETAKSNLQRWMERMNPIPNCLFEWKAILEGPLEKVLLLLTEQSEHMTRLRQSSPFSGILSPKERWGIYESFTARTYYSGSRNNCRR